MWRVAMVVLVGCSFRGPDAAGPATHDGAVTEPLAIDAAPLAIDAAPTVDTPPNACSSTGFACAGAITAAQCNGHCWATCTEAIDQPTATQRCVSSGGALAYSENLADDTCIAVTIFGANYASWTGYHQAPGSTSFAAGWSFPSGGTWTDWASGQPDDGPDNIENGDKDCAYESTGVRWHASACSAAYKWSCRY